MQQNDISAVAYHLGSAVALVKFANSLRDTGLRDALLLRMNPEHRALLECHQDACAATK